MSTRPTDQTRPSLFRRCALQALFLSVPGLAACSVETQPAAEEEDRMPIGKADIVDGSCFELGHTDHCGGQSDGTCFCDEACAKFGDCCFDAIWCEETGALPCGGLFTDACPDGFSCVPDEEPACDPEETTSCPGTCQPVDDGPTGAPCGGLVSDACPDGLVCEPLPDFECDPEETTSCPGTCQPIDDEPTGAPCGGLVSESCPDGLECVPSPDSDCDPEQTTSCPGTCQ